jgi:hypothetical protein
LYSAEKPFHVSDPREGILATTVFLAILSIAFFYLTYVWWTAGILSDPRWYLIDILFPFLTVGSGYGYIRVARVEFYDDFARVVGNRGRPDKDIKYSGMELGPLTGGGRSGSITFDISVKGEAKPKWQVWNAKVEGLGMTLHAWIQERMTGSGQPASILMAGKSPPSFLRRHPFMITAFVAISVMVMGIYFWSIPGTVDQLRLYSEIGSATIFGGAMVLILVWIARRIALDRQTSH